MKIPLLLWIIHTHFVFDSRQIKLIDWKLSYLYASISFKLSVNWYNYDTNWLKATGLQKGKKNLMILEYSFGGITAVKHSGSNFILCKCFWVAQTGRSGTDWLTEPKEMRARILRESVSECQLLWNRITTRSKNFTKLEQIWNEVWVKIPKSKCQADTDVPLSEAVIPVKGVLTHAQ